MTDEENRIFEEWFEEKKEKCEVYGNGDDFWVDDEIKKFCLMGYELGLKAKEKQIEKVEYTLKKIIETVHNDRIDEYGARLVLINDFANEYLQEIEK